MGGHKHKGRILQRPYYTDLSFEQKLLFRAAVCDRRPLFFSGSAGTGKSHLLRAIISGFNDEHPDGLAVTASTGTAAVNIAGCTIHSFSGLNADTVGDPRQLQAQIRQMRKAISERWKATEVLIIDECSMLQAEFFDALEQVAREKKRRTSFFGGIQVILCGDFLQLPPVTKNSKPFTWLFESSSFKEIKLKTSLVKSFRQQDPDFLTLLNELRVAKLSPLSKARLNQRLVRQEDIEAEQKREIERARKNYEEKEAYLKEEIARLEVEVDESLLALEKVTTQESFRNIFFRLLSSNRELITTKVTKSVTFYTCPTFPVSLKTHKKDVESVNQQRLRQTKETIFNMLAKDHNDTDKQEDPPKCITLAIGAQVLITKNLDVQKGICNGSQGVVIGIYYREASKRVSGRGLTMQHVPEKNLNVVDDDVVVELQLATTKYSLRPYLYEFKQSQERVKGTRAQFPLALAYAISIHKCQGMTLDNAIVDLKAAFSEGQVYVAISRLRSLEGLRMTSFQQDKVRANELAMRFHQSLLRIDPNDPDSLKKHMLWESNEELCKYPPPYYNLAANVPDLFEFFGLVEPSPPKSQHSSSHPEPPKTSQTNTGLRHPSPFKLRTQADPSRVHPELTMNASQQPPQRLQQLPVVPPIQQPAEKVPHVSVISISDSSDNNGGADYDHEAMNSTSPPARGEEEPPPNIIEPLHEESYVPQEPSPKFTIDMFLPTLHTLLKRPEVPARQPLDVFVQRQQQQLARSAADFFSDATPFQPADDLLFS
ncbi:Rrm3p helicase [Giardia muris]|uniref:ATP-dependent DNA helicase n=1 Tax=Giardia muris TaxID=5742 RepID=A0A4Z1SYH8_GIAMU|nr:Rrm3p helicase [Giardia muris]|eukprot:TNJ28558.1 Rrm3p helicase [Giardia muris]